MTSVATTRRPPTRTRTLTRTLTLTLTLLLPLPLPLTLPLTLPLPLTLTSQTQFNTPVTLEPPLKGTQRSRRTQSARIRHRPGNSATPSPLSRTAPSPYPTVASASRALESKLTRHYPCPQAFATQSAQPVMLDFHPPTENQTKKRHAKRGHVVPVRTRTIAARSIARHL